MATDETRQRVLDAAGEVFAAVGFQAARVRDICRAARVNLASVNYHFGDKERLYQETVRQAHRQMAQLVPMPEWLPDTPPEEKLRGFIRTMFARMLSQARSPWTSRLMMREVLQPTSACRQMVQEHFQPHFEILVRILGELLPSETPAHRRHQLAFSVVGQCVYYRVAAGVVPLLVPDRELREHFSPEELADHVAGLMLSALGVARPLGRRGSKSRLASRRKRPKPVAVGRRTTT